jgi:hypothetical protein
MKTLSPETIVYVLDESGQDTLKEYRITDIRHLDDEIIYICRSQQRPFIGYSFVSTRIGVNVFLRREDFEARSES